MTITAAAILSMYINAVQDNNNVYYYNADIENNQVVAEYVYNQTTVPSKSNDCVILKPKQKYDYSYDEANRLVARVTSRWNGEDWQPANRLEYEYTTDGYTMSLSRWDTQQQHFSEPIAKTVYAKTPYENEPIASISTYVRQEGSNQLKLTDTITGIEGTDNSTI